MSRLLPFRSAITSRGDREPRLVAIDDDAADVVFEALASKTARTIFTTLHDKPATASDLAEIAETSIQNVRYHLDKLAAAGLVEVVDTWYSERGREMKVYAPADSSLVLVSGGGSPETTLRDLLTHLTGGIGVLALASVLFDRVARPRGGSASRDGMAPGNETTPTTTVTRTVTSAVRDGGGEAGGDGTAGGGTATATETVAQTRVVQRTVVQTREVTPTPNATTPGTLVPPGGVDGGRAAIELFGVAVPPGVVFFIGGLFVLLLAVGWYQVRRRTPANTKSG